MDIKLKQTEEALVLWGKFLSNRSPDLRELLIRHYEPYANMLAAKLFASRQVKEIDFEEFKQNALVGLMESIDRYDPVKGASFQTYSSYRIKGVVLDAIEKYCERQQQITALSRLREERISNLLKEATEHIPSPFLRFVDMAIGVAIGYMLEETGMFQTPHDTHEQNIYKSRELSDLSRVMNGIVDLLPEQERSVIKCHYYQHLRFDHIAEQMNLSKSRISQIHHSALRRMNEHYDQLKLLRTDY